MNKAVWETFSRLQNGVSKVSNIFDLVDSVIKTLALCDEKWNDFPPSERTRHNPTYAHIYHYVWELVNKNPKKVNDFI